MALFNKKKETPQEEAEQKKTKYYNRMNDDGTYNPSDIQSEYMSTEIQMFIAKHKLQFGRAFIKQRDNGTFYFLADSPHHLMLLVDLSGINFTERQKNSKNPLNESLIMKEFEYYANNIRIPEENIQRNYRELIEKAKTLDPLRHQKDLISYEEFKKNIELDKKYFLNVKND